MNKINNGSNYAEEIIKHYEETWVNTEIEESQNITDKTNPRVAKYPLDLVAN